MDTSNPLISIIIPFHNREHHIQRSLNSLRQNLYRPLEFIFVDNASKDASRTFVENFAKELDEDQFKIKILDEPSIGVCKARNTGLKEARGIFVYFFDDDDEMSCSFLTDALPYLSNYDVIATRTRMIFPNGREKVRFSSFTSSPRDQILTSMLSTQSILLRKAWFLKLGGWNENLPKWNDWELGVRILKASPKLLWMPKVYHRIYQHADSLTGPSLADTYPLLTPAIEAVRKLPLIPSEQYALAARRLMLAHELYKGGMKKESCLLERSIIKEFPSLIVLKWYLRFIRKGAWLFFRICWR